MIPNKTKSRYYIFSFSKDNCFAAILTITDAWYDRQSFHASAVPDGLRRCPRPTQIPESETHTSTVPRMFMDAQEHMQHVLKVRFSASFE